MCNDLTRFLFGPLRSTDESCRLLQRELTHFRVFKFHLEPTELSGWFLQSLEGEVLVVTLNFQLLSGSQYDHRLFP